jgi:hypothetical protein
MRTSIVFLILAFYSSLAITGGDTENSLPVKGKEAIKLCMMKYTALTGEAMPEEIDRVYIDVFQDSYSVAFVHGAVGTFEKRSLDYKSVLVCAVSDGEIDLMEEPMKDALFKRPGYDTFEDYEEYEKGSVTELLYKRVNGQFEYCCSQPFDEKNIDKNNPNFPWGDKSKNGSTRIRVG